VKKIGKLQQAVMMGGFNALQCSHPHTGQSVAPHTCCYPDVAVRHSLPGSTVKVSTEQELSRSLLPVKKD